MKQWIILLLLVLSFVSCEDPKKESRSNAEGFFVIWFETLFRSTGYDSACDNESLSIPLTLSSPVLSSSVRKTYRFTTGSSGLKYNFSVSPDYPTCGVILDIRSCRPPYSFASDSGIVVSCNSGSYRNYISGGTQTCQIPNFSNQVVLVYMISATQSYPTTPCATVQFEVIP
ncbi:putative lipoprotein [Leptospira meyeri serovar Semaranga str. Veldrot Semarang 173]|nr:putative lipoprotein [Leptospira meyeri serovar Semaranga str. Veldrot Semarang 173]